MLRRPPMRERLKVAWQVLRARGAIDVDRHWAVTVSNGTMMRLHSNVFRYASGEWELLDNCDPPCDAHEARAMGGEIWERYALEVEQRAGPDGIQRRRRT